MQVDAGTSNNRADNDLRPDGPFPSGSYGGLRPPVLASLERQSSLIAVSRLGWLALRHERGPAPYVDRSPGLPQHDPACCVLAPGRCTSTSTSSRRLASWAVAKATRPMGALRQPAFLRGKGVPVFAEASAFVKTTAGQVDAAGSFPVSVRIGKGIPLLSNIIN